MNKNDLGIIGLAAMGSNLALNIANHGFNVSVYNRSENKTQDLMGKDTTGHLFPYYSLEDFVNSLNSPRRIILMVKAGAPVDAYIDSLLPLLDEGDLIIDGGNSYFEDTIRREAALAGKKILFMGTGISGGEEGALRGASIMPGGTDDAWKLAEPFLSAASAVVSGKPCVTHIGENGAGHFVKMTHNGIEYADMQLICEAYSILKNLLGMAPEEIADTFCEWNKGELNSYLIEITEKIFRKKDDVSDDYLINRILDCAGQKGTGIWTSIEALKLGVGAPTITEAVYARAMSSSVDERRIFSGIVSKPEAKPLASDKSEFLEGIRRALYLSKICAYAQGFRLLSVASKAYGWKLDMAEISLIWRGGCIIRAQFLNEISDAFIRKPDMDNILEDSYFKTSLTQYLPDLRKIVSTCATNGIPVPCFSSALSYIDTLSSDTLPANLIQAQRDFFGAHTYQRTDKEGIYHTNWQ